MGKDWIKVHQSTEVHKIELIKAALNELDIPSVSVNKRDSSYLSFGEIELYVSPANALRALRFIQTNEL